MIGRKWKKCACNFSRTNATITVDMLGEFMKCRIKINVHIRSTITIKKCRRSKWNLKILPQIGEPLNVTCSIATRAQYSASGDDFDTGNCYILDRHEMSESPKKIQKPLIDFLNDGQSDM